MPVSPSQRRIGLTGGIASGKSTVAGLLREHFALPVLDADLYARQALSPGTATTRAVLERYGEWVLAPADRAVSGPAEPAIDRAALGRIVFADSGERRWLEGQIHPEVRQRFAEELDRLGDAPVVVLMIPLLFEAGLESLCDEIWVVSCDEDQQRRRLMARDQLTAKQADARISAQWPLARKRQLADVVIENPSPADCSGDQASVSGLPSEGAGAALNPWEQALVRQLRMALNPSASG
jgi:dephospho-CoA kinase